MQWFYADASRNQVPFDEAQTSSLVQSNHLNQATLVWNESMSDWKPLGQVRPELFGGQNSPDASPGLSLNPYATPYSGQLGQGSEDQAIAAFLKNKGWIKFEAILTLIAAVPYCLLLIGIPLLLASLALLKSVELAQAAQTTGDTARFTEAMEKLGSAYKTRGIFLLVMLGLYAVFFIIMLVAGVVGAANSH